MPFGISTRRAPTPFYWFALIVGVVAFWMMARFVVVALRRRAEGHARPAAAHGALGHNVWLIRWITFVYAGFWGGGVGLLFVYYHKYIHPASLSLTNSAEGLLGVIAGGSGTLAGPLVGAAIVLLLKNYVVGLHRALEHAARLRLPVHRDVHARRASCPGVQQADGSAETPMNRTPSKSRPEESLRRPAGHATTSRSTVTAGRAPPDHRPERRRQDHAVQPDHRRPAGRRRDRSSCSARTSRSLPPHQRAHRGLARTYQIITLFPKRHARAQHRARRCSA